MQRAEVRGRRPEAGDQRAEVRGQRPECDGAIERMVEALRHRGPDDRGIAECEQTENRGRRSEVRERRSEVGEQRSEDREQRTEIGRQFTSHFSPKTRCTLGHTRLAIIDLSGAGHQPKVTGNGRYKIVYNGEIYNYRELRKHLEHESVVFGSETDTEVLLYIFARYREKSLELLEGMFAFAIHDNQTGELFIARDRMGIKPLYYFRGQRTEVGGQRAAGGGKREAGSGARQAGGGKREAKSKAAHHFSPLTSHVLSADSHFSLLPSPFLFASEVRALLASGLVPRVLDPISVNSYLSFGAVQEPRTIIKDVRSLPPAHFMRVDSDGTIKEITRYWNLPETNQHVTRAEALTETRERFAHSVQSHLVADVPLGAFLSGGIDSSAIVAMMSKAAPSRVRTFNVCFKETEFSERYIASRVAEKWGTAHTEVFLSEHELLESLPAAISDIDQPTIDGINTWAISKAVREAGITVALSGLGGDELFGGYSSFARVPAMMRYLKYLSVFGKTAPTQFASLATKMMHESLSSQKIAAAMSGNRDPLSVYAAARGLFAKNTRRALTDGNGFIKTDYDLPEETFELLTQTNGNGDLFNTVSKLELNLYMANMLLRDTDAMSMAHSLEVRVPLLDHKLVEWVYSLPGEMKRGPHPKSFFVEALGDDLLPEVARRKKMGFTLPFERWLHTSLKKFVDEVLDDREAVEQAGLDPAQVQEIWERFRRGHKSVSWSRVWALVVLVNWCRLNQVRSEE